MKSLVWFAVERTPYNDYLFEQVSKETRLEVVYAMKARPFHPWQLDPPLYSCRYVDDDFFGSLSLLRAADGIIFSGWIFWKYLLLMRAVPRGVPTAFWTDTPDTRPRKWPKRAIRAFFIRDVFRRFDQVWSTGVMGCSALSTLGCPEHKIRSFPFFCDLKSYEEITPEQRREAAELRKTCGASSPDNMVFLSMGQLIDSKRLDDAIRSIAELKERNCVLWIAGAGHQEAALTALCEQLQVRDRVFFLGWRQPHEVETTYLAADVFVHPAGRDPFPTVVLDAMAYALPVIGTDQAGSVVDRVVSGENGFIYPVAQIDQLRDAMAYFLAHPEAVKQFGERARATACRYPISHGLDLIHKLLDAPGK